MVTIFHTADIHVGVRTKRFEDKFFDLQKKFLTRLYKEAKDKNVEFVVIAGDLFDSNYIPSSRAIDVFEIISSYQDINTIIIPGGGTANSKEITGHDAYTEDSIYKRPDIQKYINRENITLLTPHKRSVIISDIAFYAGFFEVPKCNMLDARYHIGIIHGAFSENPLENEISVSELDNSFFDYICLGHYHSFKKFKKAAYPGALVQFEFLKKKNVSSGYIEVSLESDLEIKYREFEDAPRFYKIEIISKDDIEKIKDLDKQHFIEIAGYVKELSKQVEELLEYSGGNIFLLDNYIVYEREGIYGIIENSLDDVLKKFQFNEEILDEIKMFILRNMRGNITKPSIEEYLRGRFAL